MILWKHFCYIHTNISYHGKTWHIRDRVSDAGIEIKTCLSLCSGTAYTACTSSACIILLLLWTGMAVSWSWIIITDQLSDYGPHTVHIPSILLGTSKQHNKINIMAVASEVNHRSQMPNHLQSSHNICWATYTNTLLSIAIKRSHTVFLIKLLMS